MIAPRLRFPFSLSPELRSDLFLFLLLILRHWHIAIGLIFCDSYIIFRINYFVNRSVYYKQCIHRGIAMRAHRTLAFLPHSFSMPLHWCAVFFLLMHFRLFILSVPSIGSAQIRAHAQPFTASPFGALGRTFSLLSLSWPVVLNL